MIYRLTFGGLENGVVNLINNLPEDRYRHAIICITATTDFSARIRRGGVEICELRKRPGKDVAAYGRMWRILRRLRPQIVHTRNLPALDMVVPARLAGVQRFVHSEHGLDMIELDGKNAKYNSMRRASRLVVDRYITMSRDLNEWMRREIGVPAERIETIYNGVDTARFSPTGEGRSVLPDGFAPEGAVVIGTIGRLDPVKNQIALVRALACLLERHPGLRPRLRLVLIGDGAERSAIESAIAENNVWDLAWLPGFRDDTPAHYRALDIFVLPSLREGISNTLLEAMASGRPVIATCVGGNPEIVADGIVGRLVAQDADALAEAILRYVDNPELMRGHGKAGREHVLRSFSLDAMIRRYDKVYGSLLRAPASSTG